jgi:hypothetical protein
MRYLYNWVGSVGAGEIRVTISACIKYFVIGQLTSGGYRNLAD